MCLDVTFAKKEFFRKFNIKHHPRYPHLLIGFKIVKPTGLGFRPTNFGNIEKVFPISNWVHETEMRPPFCKLDKTLPSGAAYGKKSTRYKIGFHVLTSLPAAVAYAKHYGLYGRYARIFKVYFTDMCAYGTQDQCPVIISKEIFIPKQTPYGTNGRKCKKRITV
jgi:hypothetical protein